MKTICSFVLLLLLVVGMDIVGGNTLSSFRKNYLSSLVSSTDYDKFPLGATHNSSFSPTTTASTFNRHFMFDIKDLDDYNLERIDPDDRESRFFEKRKRSLLPCLIQIMRHYWPNPLQVLVTHAHRFVTVYSMA